MFKIVIRDKFSIRFKIKISAKSTFFRKVVTLLNYLKHKYYHLRFRLFKLTFVSGSGLPSF